MTADEFRAQRRQKFLNLDYYGLNERLLDMLIGVVRDNINAEGPIAAGGPNGQGSIFKDKLDLLKLHYTAGIPIQELKPLYADVIKALGEWNDAYRLWIRKLAEESGEDLRDDGTPLHFEDLFHYQLALDVVSLGILLGDGDAIRRIATWTTRHRGADLLFEALIETAVSDPRDNTDYFHTKPYDPLIDAIYAAEDQPAEASAKVKQYLEGWYKSFEGVPWHNGHLKAVEGEYMPYYGYWSFEAAAICVLYGIDDASFRDHIVYPKDLADWARAHDCVRHIRPDSPTSAANQRMASVPGGQPCPQAGWWFTPARANSLRRFEAGEVMPSFEGSGYGATFWQWAEDQPDG